MIHRRRALLGLLAAPAIVRTPGLLMPVKAAPADWPPRYAVFRDIPPGFFRSDLEVPSTFVRWGGQEDVILDLHTYP